MKKEEFKVGQKVKQFDEYDGWVKGEITEVRNDSIFIQWNDIPESCQTFKDEYESLKPVL